MMVKMNVLLLCCSFTFIGLAIAQHKNAAAEDTTINDLIDQVKYLEKKLETIVNDPLAACLTDLSEDQNVDGATK